MCKQCAAQRKNEIIDYTQAFIAIANRENAAGKVEQMIPVNVVNEIYMHGVMTREQVAELIMSVWEDDILEPL